MSQHQKDWQIILLQCHAVLGNLGSWPACVSDSLFTFGLTRGTKWFSVWKSCVWPVCPLWPPPYVDFITNYALSTDFLLCSHHNNYTYWTNRNMHHDNLPAQTSYIISFLGRRFSSLFLDIFGMFQGNFLFFTVFYDALYAYCCFQLSICFVNQSSIYWTT